MNKEFYVIANYNFELYMVCDNNVVDLTTELLDAERFDTKQEAETRLKQVKSFYDKELCIHKVKLNIEYESDCIDL